MGDSIRRHANLERELEGWQSGHNAPLRATATALEAVAEATTVVLVEGISDQIAVDALARRSGRSLEDEGIVVVPVGGAHAVASQLTDLDLARVDVSALCDRNEAPIVVGAFEGAGLEARSVFVCDPDLEGELIRAVGKARLEGLMEERGELASFRTMGKQPAWRGRPFDARAHRWIRSYARRSSVYARVLVDAAADDRIPEPLEALLHHTRP